MVVWEDMFGCCGSGVLNSHQNFKERRIMRKTMISLIFAAVMLSGCATLSDTADSACDSIVLNWLCGDS